MNLLTHLPWLSLLQKIEALAPGKCYLVGGAPRDLLLGRPALDLDVVIEGQAHEIARALQQKEGGQLLLHSAFLTATWFSPQGPAIDIITARRESYPQPGALPLVTPSTLQDDLARRDFSLNTLALRLADGALIDQHQAHQDLQKGLIRVLHPASFVDDPTRLYRAARYAARYGFVLEEQTQAWAQAALARVNLLSPERLRHELDLMLEEENASTALRLADEMGLLLAASPALPRGKRLAEKLLPALQARPHSPWPQSAPQPQTPLRRWLAWLLWLAQAESAALPGLQDRLALPAALTRQAAQTHSILSGLEALTGQPPSAWTLFLDRMELLAVYAAFLIRPTPSLRQYAETWRQLQPRAAANQLKSLGLPAGPRWGQILSRVRAAWLDGEVTTPAQEAELVQRLFSQGEAHDSST